jgi:glycosyltransferase involved in cell wall biosynthesis
VPYTTFPLAGRRGTTVLDRSTAYPVFGWRAGRVAARLSAGGTVDIVHGLGASVLGYVLSPPPAELRAPLVLNPQGLEEFGGTGQAYGGSPLKRLAYRPLQWAVRRVAASADRVIATDRAIEPTVLRHLPVSPERVVTIPNAIDLEACDRRAGPADGRRMRAILGEAVATGAEAVLVSVGRLEQNKGFHVLARALGHLVDRPWRWVLVGEGPYREVIEHELGALGLGDRVLLTGRVTTESLHAWYEAADLFVHPTLYEGSSLVTLEAMAHRRAVVATTAGGLPDKVKPGETGWLVPPGDANALATALGEALDNRVWLPGMGEKGRALAEAEFSWPSVASRTISLYEELIEERRHHHASRMQA